MFETTMALLITKLLNRILNRVVDTLPLHQVGNYISQQLQQSEETIAGEIKYGIYKLYIDLRGFKPQDIDISCEDSKLLVRAKLIKEENGNRLEKDFVRHVIIPEEVDLNTLHSHLTKDGTLRIRAQLYQNRDEKQPVEVPIAMKSKL